jgi:hypothetical protein
LQKRKEEEQMYARELTDNEKRRKKKKKKQHHTCTEVRIERPTSTPCRPTAPHMVIASERIQRRGQGW